MFRKIMWCYVFVLTLLDISLNTKLSAQGKSHGVTVQEALVEGITFQEWGKEAVGEGSRSGRAVAADALQLSPPELRFGRAALAAAHVLTVTLTNTANTTMHLASVAGTTPDFHASFFESKTLAPQANTSFSVVYLGRREGLVSAHLYIHTSLGVHKYPVSAVGVASEWGVWPLVGVRVPLNATLEPLLTMHNPTHETIQVSEVYSSGSWLGLRLPSGGESAPKHAWTLPPHSTRALVRLRLHPHAMHHQQQEQQQNNQPLTAYIRIKANMTGGGLVVGVEAISTQPGEYLSPLQIRLSTRGSRDPPDVVELEAGNSLDSGIQLDGQIWGSRCGGEPLAPPPPEQTNGQSERAPLNGQLDRSTFNGQPERSVLNGFPGVRADGVHLSLEQTALDPHQPLKRVGRLSVDYARLWAAAGEEKEAWCAGWVRVGRAAVPYSLKLVAGTFALQPPSLHFVTANLEEALKLREVHARNEFATPVYVARVRLPPEVEDHFDCEWSTPTLIEGGARAFIGRITLRRPHADLTLNLNITIVTNLTEYTLPLMVYSGKLTFEWDWPKWSADHLDLGAVGTSSTRRVSLRLVNTGPQPLCAREVGAQLAGAQLALAACAHMRPPTRACTCVGPGASAQATLTVVAPAREGPLQGTVVVATEHVATAASVTLHTYKGRVHAHPLHLYRAAPYTWSEAPLVLESSMALRMRVVDVSQPHPDLALSYLTGEEEASREVSAGRRSAGRVAYAPERLCAPRCYAGLDTLSPDGVAWARRAQALDEAALAADAALLADRYALFRRQQHHTNISLYVHTTQVVQIPVTGTVEWWWPQVAEAVVADAGLAGVGSSVRLVVRLRNPSPAHPMLLQPVISPHKHTLASETGAAAEAPSCGDKCMHSKDAFKLGEWRAVRGAATAWGDPLTANASAHALGLLLLEPKTELELTLTFTPKEAAALNAHLYLRNNLTIIESVALRGRGAYPSFELGGRRPGAGAPLIFEVSDCGGEGSATVVRTVVARNTGSVPVRLREWRVAGEPCAGRGFSLQPCASLALAPNESRPLRLAFTADFTLAQVPARLHLRADSHRAEFALLGAAPARLLAGCHARAPPPPFDPPLRTAATLLALATLALVFAAAALDAERELRRARGTRPATPARPPLDLRAVAATPSPTVAPAPASRPKPAPKKRARAAPRRTPLPLDPHAEKLAFDRWRGEVLQVQEDEDDRSSEDADGDTGPVPPDTLPLIRPITPEMNEEHHQTNDGYEADADVDAEERPPASGDEDAISMGSESASSSTPPDDRDEEPDEADEADDTDEPETISPRVQAHEMEHRDEVRVVSTPALDDAALASPEEHPRAPKLRREAETPKRGERVRTGEGGEGGTPSRGRSTVLKHHARKDKAVKRRPSRPPPSPPRSSPPRLNDAKAAGVVRWGASWSSVVAARSTPVPPEQSITPPVSAQNISAPPTLAPIGSDVRRRTEVEPRVAPIADNSLFFFNGEAHVPPRVENEFAWRAPPADERPAFITPVPHEFLGGEDGSPVGGAFRPMSGVWGGWGSWGVMRPPPGFGTPAQPVRAYDPFRSLASIWAPGGLDWRPDTPHHNHHPQDEDNNNNTH